MEYVQKDITVVKDTPFPKGVLMEVIKIKKAKHTVNHVLLDMCALQTLPPSLTLSVRLGGIVQ